ncbi:MULTISPECIES: hypothetical protein [Metallosphaera]|uniref:Uncharacterized protein n=2 Tax=Metallosphaera TaxID=41980 RepID=A0A0K1T0M8_9CREN|nr:MULTISPECIES: hypothetical protein [Metallosphaera]AKV73719.1 hypothetical protein MsedA_0615 [Metallosphaera sedula]AKV75959.1 hypothetical protein MsedB_0615 [Metallosphaera sedula]AKV78210.1 hypothetical protein MsedC_0614 [Metallosphaera sedula]AKV80455.1 hypothetical protein MsedD_0615 [Metallosphaera sedula]AKV82703.1 hypothetical protein MsedE_0615 [Metallosphaera sedula]
MDLEELEIMNLGVIACQRRVIRIGNYEINFSRQVSDDAVYLVEVKFRGHLKSRGVFTDFRNATLFAGSWIKSLI